MKTSALSLNRRSFLITAAGTAAATVTGVAADAPGYTLAPLPYAFDALEPHVDAKTMEIHHGKHHQAYVTNLNTALAAVPEAPTDILKLLAAIPQLPEKSQAAVRNNGGGHYNHTLFWSLMGKPGSAGVGGEPSGKIGPAITKAFGSLKDFQTKFNEAGLKQFGSGWAWLIAKADGELAVVSTPNQDCPLMKGIVPAANEGTPLLGLDVWEHAYYLKYQNKRADYIAAWWSVVNWKRVDELFTAASK
jgi:superoxide dismutase, Fe-Mn family